MSETLKPCPFCGKQGQLSVYEPMVMYAVHCTNAACNIEGPDATSGAAAIAAWNQRKETP